VISLISYNDIWNEDLDELPDGCYTVSPLFGGYINFYTKIIFDKNGKFIRQEFLE
jgi:hypothetical protein